MLLISKRETHFILKKIYLKNIEVIQKIILIRDMIEVIWQMMPHLITIKK